MSTKSSKKPLADVIPDSEDEFGSEGDFDWFEEVDIPVPTDEAGEEERSVSQEVHEMGKKEKAVTWVEEQTPG